MVLFHKKGFSLIELMVTLIISSIILFMAIPGIKSLVGGRQIDVVTEKLYGSIMFARSEAVRRAGAVSLCRSLILGSCVGNGSEWATGWIVFFDNNSNGTLDASDEKIREYQAQSSVISIKWSQGFFLRFNSRGVARDMGTFTVCRETGARDAARAVIVSITGRARIKEINSC